VVGLRERQRAQTQRLIQEQAVRLFLEHGYERTTVSDVAAAAGVSPMTVYRHFPTKQDLVLRDEYDALIAQRIAARAGAEPLIRRIGQALTDELAAAIGAGMGMPPAPGAERTGADADGRDLLLARIQLVTTTPALRTRRWENQYLTQLAIVQAMGTDPPDPELEFRVTVATGACLAAASAALFRWAADDGRADPVQLMQDALAVLAEGES